MIELPWLTEEARQFLSLDKGYLRNQTVEERYEAIADNIEKISKIEGIASRFKRYISKGWVSFASPVLANFGHEHNLPISCNKMTIEDALPSILNGLKEMGMLSKYGAGVAVDFSDIRPAGSEISSGGKSEGVIPFIGLYQDLIKRVSQNGVRRGFMTAYLSVDHPEIMDFLEIGTDGNPINIITTGVSIPEGWMASLQEGDAKKRKIWAKILRTRSEIGYPYILFLENCNNALPQVYKDKGMKVRMSNICVTGDQRVVSHLGYLTAKELYDTGKDLLLFDDANVVKSSKMRLIDPDADVFKITLDNGMDHCVTAYHKVKTRSPYKEWNKQSKKYEYGFVDKECKDLQEGDLVYIQSKKGIFGTKDLRDEAFLLGLWQGDGTKRGESSYSIDLWENDFDLEPEILEAHKRVSEKYLHTPRYSTKGDRFIEKSPSQNGVRKRGLNTELYGKLFFDKDVVPQWIWESDEETQWSYVRGLLLTDGTVHVSKLRNKNKLKNEVIQINIASIRLGLLKQLQLIFNNLGLQSSIRVLRKTRKALLPDGRGGHKEYDCKDCYRLIVGNYNAALQVENKTGFLSRKNVAIENREYRDNTKKCYKVVSVDYIGRQPVYCVTVDSETHHWVCNGVVTHNCSEIVEYCDKDKTFACCLSSVVLTHWDEWKDDPDFIFDMNILLDCVIEEYIHKGKKCPGLERAVKFAEEHRAVGLGVLGWHSLMQRKRIAIGSMDCFALNNDIFKRIREESDRASKWMAENWGEPEILKGYGFRNTTRMAVAPTKSTSFIVGNHSLGIEPIKSNYHMKKLAKIQDIYKNPELVSLLQEKQKDTPDVWDSILINNGSVQHLDFLSDHEKNVFKTFSEVSQADLISLAAQRQKYIDQGQSLNLMFHPKTSGKDINRIILEAFNSGIKSLYYQYSISAAQELNRTLLQCSSCEG